MPMVSRANLESLTEASGAKNLKLKPVMGNQGSKSDVVPPAISTGPQKPNRSRVKRKFTHRKNIKRRGGEGQNGEAEGDERGEDEEDEEESAEDESNTDGMPSPEPDSSMDSEVSPEAEAKPKAKPRKSNPKPIPIAKQIAEKQQVLKQFCLMVSKAWEAENGFVLFELESETKRLALSKAGKSSKRTIMAREWYRAEEVQPKDGFMEGKHGFLLKTKQIFKRISLPPHSWIPVNGIWRRRAQFSEEFNAGEKPHIVFRTGTVCTILYDDDIDHVMVRADDGKEWRVPKRILNEIRRFIEIEDESDKVAKAYSNLTGTVKKSPSQQKYKFPPKGGEDMDGVGVEGSSSKDKRQRRKTDRLSPTWNSEDEEFAGDFMGDADDEEGDPDLRRRDISAPTTRRCRYVLDDAPEVPSPCAVCFNPNKKLGNAKTIVLTCNRCDCLIKQGWPYHQFKEPKVPLPGRAVTIVNLCIYCYQAVQREGSFTPKEEDDQPARRRIGKGGGLQSPAVSSRKDGPHRLGARVGTDPPKGRVISAADFEAKDVEQTPEPTCNCPFCGQLYHQKCIKYSKEIYGPIPPRCLNPICQEMWDAADKPDPFLKFLQYRARDIKTAPVSRHIQNYVENSVFQGKKHPDTGFLVRLVSNVPRTQESSPSFTSKFGKKTFPYLLKNVMSFIECEDGSDIAFLSLVVAEFGPDAPEPNRNKAYISYIDSVHLYHCKGCRLRGTDMLPSTTCSMPQQCASERKEVVRRVLMAYMDSVRERNFEALYIWAMPPNELHHDYVFHMRPLHQHCPNQSQLDQWYTKLLSVAQDEGIISGFDSNALPEDAESQVRRLPSSLFGADTSLSEIPQFPGGLMMRVLEAALAGDNDDAEGQNHASAAVAVPSHKRATAMNVDSRNGSSREQRVLSRETAIQSRERHERALSAMNSFLEKHTDSGSIFVVQYSQNKGAPKPKAKILNSVAKELRETVEDDPIISVDEDKHEGNDAFTLNECGHLCALLNDMHLQFNDVRQGKHATMSMINQLKRHLIIEDKEEERAVQNIEKEIKAEAELALSGVVPEPPKQPLFDELKKYEVAAKQNPEADMAVQHLRKRRERNLAQAKLTASAHRCNSRCADGKCNKYDWEYNCPVVCRCERDLPSPKIVWPDFKWAFCEWCCSWQHTCCMREDANVCFDESLDSREICYDTDFNYMCQACSAMPQIKEYRAQGDPKEPLIMRHENYPDTPSEPEENSDEERRELSDQEDSEKRKRLKLEEKKRKPEGEKRGVGRPRKDREGDNGKPRSSDARKREPGEKRPGPGRPRKTEEEKQRTKEERKKRKRLEREAMLAAAAAAAEAGGLDPEERPKKLLKKLVPENPADANTEASKENGQPVDGEELPPKPKRGRPRKSEEEKARSRMRSKEEKLAKREKEKEKKAKKAEGENGEPRKRGRPRTRDPDEPRSRKSSKEGEKKEAEDKDKDKKLAKGRESLIRENRELRDEIYQSRFPTEKAKLDYSIGQIIECQDKEKFWPAKVIEVDSTKRTPRVLLHFQGWAQRYDTWISVDSPRLRMPPIKK